MKNQNNFPLAAFLRNAKKNVLGLSMLVGIAGAGAQNIFPPTGNAGIGTTTPGYPLHISTGATTGTNFQVEGTNPYWTGGYFRSNSTTATTYLAFTSNNGTNLAYHSLNPTGNYSFFNGAELLTLTKTGFIGVKNSTPTFALDIKGRIRLASDGSGAGAWFANNAGTANVGFVGLENDNHVGFWGNNGAGWAFKVNTTNGNVGIGTTNTGTVYKLSVNGSIRAKELVVETGWADFVFDKNYKLRSLNEVESYIAANKHLPDVPSAAEVEANGVKVGEMESKLLQKVEELTLYVIELNKKVSALEKENQELKK